MTSTMMRFLTVFALYGGMAMAQTTMVDPSLADPLTTDALMTDPSLADPLTADTPITEPEVEGIVEAIDTPITEPEEEETVETIDAPITEPEVEDPEVEDPVAEDPVAEEPALVIDPMTEPLVAGHIPGTIPDVLSGFIIAFPRRDDVDTVSFKCKKRVFRGVKKIAAAGGFEFADFDSYWYNRGHEEDEMKMIQKLCNKKDWVHEVNGIKCDGYDDPTVDTEDLGFDDVPDSFFRRGLSDQEATRPLTPEEEEEEKRRLEEERKLLEVNYDNCRLMSQFLPFSKFVLEECFNAGYRRRRTLQEESGEDSSGRELWYNDPVGDKIRMETKALEFCTRKLSECIDCDNIFLAVF